MKPYFVQDVHSLQELTVLYTSTVFGSDIHSQPVLEGLARILSKT